MDNQWGQTQHAIGRQHRGTPQNYYDLDAEYSISNIDTPHRIVLSPRRPDSRARERLAASLDSSAAGAASAVIEFVSGPPISAYVTNLSAANLGLFNGLQRPNLTGQPVSTPGDDLDRIASADHPTAAWLNAAGYANPGLGAFGNAPRTDGDNRYQFRKNTDAVFTKSVPIQDAERRKSVSRSST